MKKVVLATGNAGKVAEMQQVLADFGLNILPQSDFNIGEAEETGLTFVENAILKARYACEHTGLPAIADDSGIEVRALNGAPGIYSARYADGAGDQANNQKLLAELKDKDDRTARFQCVLVYLRHAKDPVPIICKGTWEGEISHQPAGENGFGYDPIFYIPEMQCHSAELDPTAKAKVSHRARALAKLKKKLRREYDSFT